MIRFPVMASRRKNESIEDYRKRDAAAKRERRLRRTLQANVPQLAASAGVTRAIPPAVLEGEVVANAGETAIRLHHQIALMLREAQSREAKQVLTPSAKMRRTKEIYLACKAFQHLTAGVKTMQALATHDEVQAIIELVDPCLSDDVRERLQTLLQRIDARAGIA